jgi:hypothetical protein
MSSTLALAESLDHTRQSALQTKTEVQGVVLNHVKTPFVEERDARPVVPPVPSGSVCPQWYDLAMQFFSPNEWDTIDFLLNRESRCDAQALNPSDTNGKPSYSLFQINGFWCSPSKHYALGFLQEHGVLSTCSELFDPPTQFRAARAIYVEGLVRHGVGWRSWGSYPETR